MNFSCLALKLRFASCLLVLLGTMHCSMGTEVGNGVKPSNPDSTASSGSGATQPAATNASTDSPTPVQANTSGTAAANIGPISAILGPNADMATSGVLAGTAGSAASSVLAGAFNSTNSTTITPASQPVDPALSRIFASCASPFSSVTLASPLTLSRVASDGTKTPLLAAAYYASAKRWVAADATYQLVHQIVPDPSAGPYGAAIYDASGQILAPAFTCDAATTDPAATLPGSATTYIKIAVELHDIQQHSYAVSWYLQKVGTTLKLFHAELGPSALGPTLILEAP